MAMTADEKKRKKVNKKKTKTTTTIVFIARVRCILSLLLFSAILNFDMHLTRS